MRKILKKLVKPIIILCITAAMLTPVIQVASAAGPVDLLPEKSLNVGLDESQTGYSDQLKYYEDLPEFDEKIVFRSAIKTMLYLAGFLVTLGLIVVGYMFLAGSANEESLTKARKVLGYIAIGVLVMAASYAIISGILQIKLF
jgi:hypothetical protein